MKQKPMKLAGLALAALTACANPSSTCQTPGQTECSDNCVDLNSDSHNCGGCGLSCDLHDVCVAGKCGPLTCDHPDVYAACWIGGGVVGVCSDNGGQTPTAIVALIPGDAGAGAGVVVPEFQSGIISGSLLWLLDYQDNQIDVVDIATWPPVAKVAINAGTSKGVSDTQFSVTQLATCDGMVLALRTQTPLLEAYDPTTFAFINEVSLASDAGYQYPAAVACDGKHTAYVTDSANNTIAAVDLSTFTITAMTTLPAADQIGALPDGGFISASLTAIAVQSPASGPTRVVVALQNLDSSYKPAADSTVFTLDPGLSTWSAGIDPQSVDGGIGCLDAYQLAVSPDQSTAYAACAGISNTAGATTVQPYNPTGNVGVIQGQTALPTVVTALSNPTSLAFLKNGLLAIGDYTSQSEVAFYNPADGGISYVSVNCPLQTDGGLYPLQGITAVVAAP